MHLKIVPSFLMLLFSVTIFAQEATEIYLFDLIRSNNEFGIHNPVNISKSAGYDNQPSFTQDGSGILFASTRNDQTDIARYDIEEHYRTWLTHTPNANEYSPAYYPNKKKYFTCVRLNEDGSQLLYKYSYKNKEPEVLLTNLKVGYFVWFNDKVVISYVLGDIETLQVSNLKFKINYPIQQEIGRSLQRIPNEDLISYISKSHEVPEIYSIDPNTSETKYIADAIEGSEDLTWSPDGTIFMGKEDQIFKFNPKTDKKWTPVNIESKLPIQNITRVVVSPDGTKIVLVVKE